ncbi:MAG: stage 0 sporulation family protein [Firmicutes bacterium]|jgi:cell fate regulator YaaT (PSP1 superfamily)|nr:stage 0 sporulation family protein [Bacillota bacterium]MBQ1690362.1 stage 0 sporulation family protein [Bacillota bacterium]MBQ1715797.1 stage 0 sporulation family protein [Bacillota bacterium]MBQ1825477.1 stage 0 sporulation family protein [Bacillota bacterium]MBQ2305194.1 stage 0 sporulation family protein [Bacillota bacterium]
MVTVIGVRFKQAGKVYYFDPGEQVLNIGDHVIVETARGTEFGEVSMANSEVPESGIVAPLKPIIRIATEQDYIRHEENEKKKARAMELCQEKIDKRGLDMKLVDVEYTFDNSKVIFYFTADGRVDFRELVKDLAGVFRMRIELRQIGVRDEAKMLGGIGSCGRPLCCHSWLADFEPVSIKMAKVQNLSLSPTKISGICGRLMCCLKFENDVYTDLRRNMPEVGEQVKTPEGLGKVVDTTILEGKVKVRLYIDDSRDSANDQGEKLSSDIYTFTKDEIRRVNKRFKKKQDDIFKGVDAEELKELEKIIQD